MPVGPSRAATVPMTEPIMAAMSPPSNGSMPWVVAHPRVAGHFGLMWSSA
jgi:hypothetical protein